MFRGLGQSNGKRECSEAYGNVMENVSVQRLRTYVMENMIVDRRRAMQWKTSVGRFRARKEK